MGKTIQGALDNAQRAMRDWIEITEEEGRKVPAPRSLERLRRDPEVVEALAEGATLASVPLIRESGKPVKANLSINSGVLAVLDEEARARDLTRSGMVELACVTGTKRSAVPVGNGLSLRPLRRLLQPVARLPRRHQRHGRNRVRARPEGRGRAA